MSNANTVILCILLVITGLMLAFNLYRFMLKRAVFAMIRTFRKRNAVGFSNARDLFELGVTDRPLFSRLWRDYRPAALRYLVGTNIIRRTDDGRFYLVEEQLVQYGLENIK